MDTTREDLLLKKEHDSYCKAATFSVGQPITVLHRDPRENSISNRIVDNIIRIVPESFLTGCSICHSSVYTRAPRSD